MTPSPIVGGKIVFLPDPALVYEGRQIDNVRVSLVDDPLIEEFIQASENFFAVTNRGRLADYHGELVLTPNMRAISERCVRLEQAILAKYVIDPPSAAKSTISACEAPTTTSAHGCAEAT